MKASDQGRDKSIYLLMSYEWFGAIFHLAHLWAKLLIPCSMSGCKLSLDII